MRQGLCSLHGIAVAFHRALIDEYIWIPSSVDEDDEHDATWKLKNNLYDTKRVDLFFQVYVISVMMKIVFPIMSVSVMILSYEKEADQ